jgi:predicted  nucleic acid-binding Zn-ribbon protein
MEIQNEAQAAKVRAVMGAMIGKLQSARAANDKELTAELKAQYTTLQLALQEYKASRPEPEPTPQQADDKPKAEIAALKAELAAAKAEHQALKERLAKAEETFKAQRATITDLKYKLELAEDEVRTLRAPVQANPHQTIKPSGIPERNWTTADILGELVP